MKQTPQPFEPRGVVPPEHLSAWVKKEIGRIGEVALADRIGVARNAVLRVAAGIHVQRTTLTMVQIDHDREHAHAA